MDKLKENPRLVVATLITAGIVALLVGNSGNNNSSDNGEVAEEDTTQSQTAESSEAPTSDETEKEDVVIGSAPVAGPVEVKKDETSFSATVREGDNQTVVVRQVVNDFLSDRSQSLSAEQRLYVETVLVDGLPRNNLVHSGDVISIDATVINDTVVASAALTEAQLALWTQYL